MAIRQAEGIDGALLLMAEVDDGVEAAVHNNDIEAIAGGVVEGHEITLYGRAPNFEANGLGLIIRFLNGDWKSAVANLWKSSIASLYELQSFVQKEIRFDRDIEDRPSGVHREYLKLLESAIKDLSSVFRRKTELSQEELRLKEMLSALLIRELENLTRELERRRSPHRGNKQASLVATAIRCAKLEEKFGRHSWVAAYLEGIPLDTLIAVDDRDETTRDHQYLEIGAQMADWAFKREGYDKQDSVDAIIELFLRNLAEKPIMPPTGKDYDGLEWDAHRKALGRGTVSPLEIMDILTRCSDAVITRSLVFLSKEYIPTFPKIISMLETCSIFSSTPISMVRLLVRNVSHERIPQRQLAAFSERFGISTDPEDYEETEARLYKIFYTCMNAVSGNSYDNLCHNPSVQRILWNRWKARRKVVIAHHAEIDEDDDEYADLDSNEALLNF
jgi:hypothetical protein